MKRFPYIAAAAVLITGLTATTLPGAIADEAALEKIHQKIIRKYDAVEHISSAELTRALSNGANADDIVLFDVREVEEHAVSHLKNATQIKPGIWTSSFMRAHAEKIKGKTVVFYCSVGRRSSYAASYLQETLKKNGATKVLNLKGGIFSWHNQQRPLNLGQSATPYVHPFSKYWGRLIERRELTRFSPVPPASQSASDSSSADSSNAVTQTSQ